MKKLLFSAITVHLLAASVSEAKYFSCTFTEPFFDIYISTESKIVTVDPIMASETGGYSKKINVTSIKEDADKTTINDNIVIFNNQLGNNGMSDHVYPYLIIYTDGGGQKHYGGCDSETKVYGTTVSRFISLTGFGSAVVNYWPGEYGHVTGYKTKKNVTLPAGSTYARIESDEPTKDEQECKLTKNQIFVPSLAKKGQIYATVFQTTKFMALENYKDAGIDDGYSVKKGDIYYELAYASEGYCIVESNGKIETQFCPSFSTTNDNKPLFQQVDENNKPIKTNGDKEYPDEYVFTKCQDGHWTWISKKMMSENSAFESAHDPKLDQVDN